MNRIGAFISIPRNASKAVLHLLELGRNRDIETTSSPVIYENHQRGSVLRKRYDLDPLFVFCFSRDPYDRCISWYQYHRSLEPYRSMSFEAWIRAGLPHHWVRQNQTDYAAEGISPLLQYTFVKDCKVDFTGRIENFAEDFRVVVDKLNARCVENGLRQRFIFSDRRYNKSKRRKDVASYYTAATRQMVYSLLQKDFDHFGYDKL